MYHEQQLGKQLIQNQKRGKTRLPLSPNLFFMVIKVLAKNKRKNRDNENIKGIFVIGYDFNIRLIREFPNSCSQFNWQLWQSFWTQMARKQKLFGKVSTVGRTEISFQKEMETAKKCNIGTLGIRLSTDLIANW